LTWIWTLLFEAVDRDIRRQANVIAIDARFEEYLAGRLYMWLLFRVLQAKLFSYFIFVVYLFGHW
jgi:hypothetical protein